ncbi:hypothetical protein IV38_GL000824 [Lactobacillus selangorensis]|uniref:Probable membrane transporter protein n=1 Tax=Lactobacillus selangorensis TaxID=81857 RepID=A0A0R2FIY5_9LACO|nr:sulfite exporter TauE/SafE family protein [Lactobacillus selangorensis]KRN28623.1 hypothetical protein IV38_GL000824 [Lactobacillus selangorensis]KRN32967.1 hypothetical protein IV40_GL001029 [Lactobacillus selangorensis]
MSLSLMILILFAAGLAGGLLSSVAGLASLVSYPVLLALGLPPVSANTTNTASLIFTGIGSSLSSVKDLCTNRKLTWHIAAITLFGGLIGSIILGFAPATTFAHIVPFLIFSAGCLMLWSEFRPAKPHAAQQSQRKFVLFLKQFAIFLVGVYIGYFGASAGIIMVALLTVTIDRPYTVCNSIKNFASFATNVLSLIVYALTTKVYWWMVVPMGAGMFIGGYVGPVIVRHVPTRPLRVIVSIGAFGLAGYLFYTTYFK